MTQLFFEKYQQTVEKINGKSKKVLFNNSPYYSTRLEDMINAEIEEETQMLLTISPQERDFIRTVWLRYPKGWFYLDKGELSFSLFEEEIEDLTKCPLLPSLKKTTQNILALLYGYDS